MLRKTRRKLKLSVVQWLRRLPGMRETLVRSQVVANFNFLLVFLSIISTFLSAPKKEKSWSLASY